MAITKAIAGSCVYHFFGINILMGRKVCFV